MYRIPALYAQTTSRALAASATTASSTASTVDTRQRLSSYWGCPPLQQPQPPVQPNTHCETTHRLGGAQGSRVARWWRRLRGITRQLADAAQQAHLLPRPSLLHEAQLRRMDEAAAVKTVTAASAAGAEAADGARIASPPSAAATADSMGVDALLTRLQRAIRGDGGRVPGVVVEDVWAVLDLLVPPAVRDDVSTATLTPDIEENFFLFVATLNELDFDLQAVVRASQDLEAKLDDYLAQLRQREGRGRQLAASRQTKSAIHRGNEASGLNERLMKAKGEVIRCCFEARNVGAPLYYMWLRHTVSLSDGLRRLMSFRKLTHHFQRLCSKRVEECAAKLTSASTNLSPEAEDDVVRQQLKWRSRQMEVDFIDNALSLLFRDFFAKEYLVVEELTWCTTAPSLLEKVTRAESVHPFGQGLEDMRCRLQPTHHRHLFVFMHPAVAGDPLVAVQVALTRGIASSVDHILGRPTPLADPANTTHAAGFFRQLRAAERSSAAACETSAAGAVDGNVDTAVFYSINSLQSALRGMDLGNHLIKRVVKEIEDNINARRRGQRLTPIHIFSTLSPIPLYVKWLAGKVAALAAPSAGVTGTATAAVAAGPTGIFGITVTREEEERMYLAPLREAVADYALRHPTVLAEEARVLAAASTNGSQRSPTTEEDRTRANAAALTYVVRLFQTATLDDAPSAAAARPWWWDHALTGALEGPLLRSVAVYLCTVKRHGSTRIRDPVGNFHVSNGATVYRLNFMANATAQGSCESACVMVNYWYDLSTVSSNVAGYEARRHVALGEPVAALLAAEARQYRTGNSVEPVPA